MVNMTGNPQEELTPWFFIKTAFWIVVAGGFFVFVLAGIENIGGSARVPWFVAIFYYIGGKWTVALVSGLLAILAVAEAIRLWRKKRAAKGSDSQAQESLAEPTNAKSELDVDSLPRFPGQT
jgi:hypothetical protein